MASFLDFLLILFVCAIGYYIIYGEFIVTWKDSLTWQLIYIAYLTITPVFWSGYVIGKRIFKIGIKRYIDDQNLTLGNMF
ncbi:hypothetical protein [Cytobacillus oceanisediminis]|uniref:hypothetical protein n=1 Tax=Cytobacillus oceanisediminis TaxID=665099 RepID=UPI002811434C|nr:hypothetical protein [Cytobacillus oceanisediminis]